MPQPLLKISFSRNSEIEFFQSFLIYYGKKILYSDIDGISYLYSKIRRSVNFVPVGTSHSYFLSFREQGRVHKLPFSGIGSLDTFSKMANAFEVLIKPFVIVNLLLDYIKNNKIEIGDLVITPEGIYKKRKWRSSVLLPWERYYGSALEKGYVVVSKKDERKQHLKFYDRMMSSLNAVVLPDILSFLSARNGIVDEATKKQIIEKKTQLTNASAQDAVQDLSRCGKCGEKMVEESQKFCGKCGSPLIPTT